MHPYVHIYAHSNLLELLGCIFSRHALENLGSAWMIVQEIRHVVNAAVDDDVQSLVGTVVLRDFCRCECFRHDDG